MAEAPRAIIIGGGIGGLCAAIALHRAGLMAHVYERAPDLQPVGAGLSLWVNAVRALDQLGLGDGLRALSAPEFRGTVRNAKGKPLSRASYESIAHRFGGASYVVHRADLQQLLLNAVSEGVLQLGRECVSISQSGTRVNATFADGFRAEGDLLIGADGIHSLIRQTLFGAQKPRYAGYTAWRGVTTFPGSAARKAGGSESWGRGRRFGITFMNQDRVYWFAVNNAPEHADDAPDGQKALLQSLFKGWHWPVEALIEATPEDQILRNDIIDRPPIEHWTVGRITLLGDAAHPMTPNMGQGACQAIEDAVVLGKQLVGADGIPAALRRYEAARIPRTTRIVNQSYQLGRLANSGNRLVCALRDFVTWLTPPSIVARQLEPVVGYTIE